MSVVIKTSEMQYRDGSGAYHGINAIAEKKIADQEAALDAKIVSTQAAVDSLEAQKNTIAATIASMAQLGTDTTLTTPGMAADAAKVGDLKSVITGKEDSLTSKFSFTNSKRIKSDTGVYQGGSSYSNFKANENFVKIEGYAFLRITMMRLDSYQANGIAFYSSNSEGSYISGVGSASRGGSGDYSEVKEIPVPATAKYVRTTYFTDTAASTYEADAFSCTGVLVGVNDRLDDLEDTTEELVPAVNEIEDTMNGIGDEISDLKSAINGSEVDITSSFTFTDEKRIRCDTGVYQGGSSYSSMKANQNFVKVEGYQYLKITMPKMLSLTTNGLAFYSAASESNYVSGVAFPVGEDYAPIEMEIPIPATAKYVRTTYWVTTEVAFSCKKIIIGVNDKLDDLEEKTEEIDPLNEIAYGVNENITSKFSFTSSKAIRATDGVYVSNDYNKATSGFVNIEKYDLLKIKIPVGTNTSTVGLAFYSSASESAFISGVPVEVCATSGTREVIIPVPANAKRVRTSYPISGSDFSCYGIIISDKEEYNNLYTKKGTIINDLRTGNSEDVSVISGTYGGENATYAVDINKTSFRLAVDFQITDNINTGDSATNINVADVQANTNKELTLTKQKPYQFFGSFQSSNNTYYQALRYRSGFTCNGTNVSRNGNDTKPLVGDVAFSLWLKGSYSDTEMPKADLLTRESWLDTYQDLAIVIESDTISMIRDGIGTEGNEYNDGQTSTLFTVSLKEGDEYKTLGVLYEELAELQETYNFVLKFNDLSARKTCADLLQFGKMKLVGKYKQQIDTSGSSTAYYCDSYPCYFPFAVDETWHTLEIVKNGSTLYMAVDGKSVNSSFAGKVNKVILDGRAVTFRNLEANLDGSFGDAEVFPSGTYNHSAIISSRSPHIVPLMGHDMITTYQGSGVIPAGNAQQQSLTRVEDIIQFAKRKGYAIVSLDQFHDMWVGKIPMPKRVAFFILDDMRVAEAYQNLRNRSAVTRNGATLNFATVDYAYNGSSVVEANFKLFTSMRANGWCCASHSFRHDVRFGEKNSVVFAWELKQIMKDADKLNWLNDVIVANGAGGTQNQYNMMNAEGFCIVFHNDGYYDTRQNNPMKIGRTNIGDNTTGTSPYSILM